MKLKIKSGGKWDFRNLAVRVLRDVLFAVVIYLLKNRLFRRISEKYFFFQSRSFLEDDFFSHNAVWVFIFLKKTQGFYEGEVLMSY
ncbi:hypothetical protein B0A78_05575 [Flavobacterium columnare NBRC 100251 = ATCC 23463]|nr:hypothetical protein BU993_01530 [Flavobacterium columnare]OOB82455.1 hypothetical protein BZL53_08865 [Flavobacterium columnare]PDS25090.1 hypothetical protein B0A78_05575 [Flavobacterium columnare NBRC 100251 = ATCC 23463]